MDVAQTADKIKEHVSLKPFNTFGVEATARYFLNLEHSGQLMELIESHPEWMDSYYMLGGGSNVLFTEDYPGLILLNRIFGKEVIDKTEMEIYLQVGAGENWHKLVRYAVEQGWGGIENLSLIPGTVGAAPIQNIGAYGAELKDVFHSLEAVELATGNKRQFRREECGFGYRNSVFKQQEKGRWCITSVTLRLSRKPEVNLSYQTLADWLEDQGITEPTIRQVSDAVIAIRRSKLPDPSQIGNAGSFFKNPVLSPSEYEALKGEWGSVPAFNLDDGNVKVPAGWLIDKAGWRGHSEQRVGTYQHQALVIVNFGGASGKEIWDFARRIQESVQSKFGIKLQPEVNVVGPR